MAKHLSSETPVIVINNNQNKRRNPLVWLMTLAVVAVVGIGGTYAYLTFVTDPVSNALTTSTGLSAEVEETAWTADEQTKAANMVPGTVVAKNPTVKNNSENANSELVAIEVTFTKEDGTTELTADEVNQLLSVYNIYDGETADDTKTDIVADSKWTEITGDAYSKAKRYYYYADVVAQNASTADALFDQVSMKSTATQEQIENLNKAIGANWKIVIKAAAIQAIDGKTGADFVTGNPTWASLFTE